MFSNPYKFSYANLFRIGGGCGIFRINMTTDAFLLRVSSSKERTVTYSSIFRDDDGPFPVSFSWSTRRSIFAITRISVFK